MTEHLRTSCDAVVPLVEIPYVCKEGCTVGDFESYPSLQGYKLANNGWLIVQEDGWAELHILLARMVVFWPVGKISGSPHQPAIFRPNCPLLWASVHSYNGLTADAA